MFCPQCGKQIGNEGNFCMYCGYNLSAIQGAVKSSSPAYTPAPAPANSTGKSAVTPEPKAKKEENVFLGCVGAVLGAAVAGLLITLLTKIGLIASAFGAGIAILCILGYEKLGGKTSNTTIVITLLLCLVVPYLADRAAWAMVIKESFAHVSLWEAFLQVPDLVGSAIDGFEYAKDLVMMYVFTAAGAIGTIKSML